MSIPYDNRDEKYDEEKGPVVTSAVVAPQEYTDSEDQDRSSIYDPSKESIWTRMGLNAESFKRAPGNTG